MSRKYGGATFLEEQEENQIGIRVAVIVASALLIAYGFQGLMENDLYIPFKRSGGVHLTDWRAGIGFFAIASFVGGLLVVGRAITRIQAEARVRVANVFLVVGAILFLCALLN